MVQDLRYFLSMGMLCSGLFTFLFGLALTAKIKSLAYFIVIQVIEGENRRSEDKDKDRIRRVMFFCIINV